MCINKQQNDKKILIFLYLLYSQHFLSQRTVIRENAANQIKTAKLNLGYISRCPILLIINIFTASIISGYGLSNYCFLCNTFLRNIEKIAIRAKLDCYFGKRMFNLRFNQIALHLTQKKSRQRFVFEKNPKLFTTQANNSPKSFTLVYRTSLLLHSRRGLYRGRVLYSQLKLLHEGHGEMIAHSWSGDVRYKSSQLSRGTQ